MKYQSWNILFIIFQSAAVIILTYTLLFKSIFSSIDALDVNLKNAGVYNHLAAMIKQALIIRIPNNPDHLLGRALAINIINTTITPELITQYSKPILNFGITYIAKPAQINNRNQIVIPTQQYKDEIHKEIQTWNLPPFLMTVGQYVQNAVPKQIVLMDLDKHPYGIIPSLVKAKYLYQHINTVNTIAAWTAVISVLGLIAVNIRSLKRLFKTLSIGYLVSGLTVLILSFLVPYVVVPLTNAQTNLNPIVEAEFNAMIDDVVKYYFGMTRFPSLYILAAALVFFLIYHWSLLTKFQTAIDSRFFKQTAPAPAPFKRRSRKAAFAT